LSIKLVGACSLVVAASLVVGTGGAFVGPADSVAEEVTLQPSPGPNGAYAYLNGGELVVDLTAANSNVSGEGISPNGVTVVEDVFRIHYSGDRFARIWITDDSEAITLRANGSPIQSSTNATRVDPNETVAVGLRVDTTGPADGLLNQLTINARLADPGDVPGGGGTDGGSAPVDAGPGVTGTEPPTTTTGSRTTTETPAETTTGSRTTTETPAETTTGSRTTTETPAETTTETATETGSGDDDTDATEADDNAETTTDPPTTAATTTDVTTDTTAGTTETTVTETTTVGTTADDAPTPDIRITDKNLERPSIEAGGSAVVTVTLTNEGSAAGERTITVAVDGIRVSRTVSLPPGESTIEEFTLGPLTAGEYTVTVDGVDVWTLTVAESGDRTSVLERGGLGAQGLVLPVVALSLLASILVFVWRRRSDSEEDES
jgi:hypothetical protein